MEDILESEVLMYWRNTMLHMKARLELSHVVNIHLEYRFHRFGTSQ